MKSANQQPKTFDQTLLRTLQGKIEKEKIRSCLILHHDEVVFETYKNKKIATKPQKIHSLTKSILSALIGIAQEQGVFPELDTPIVQCFPALERDPDPRKKSITIDHLLTMTPGFDWPEFGIWNAFPQMIYSSHWVRFVLERDLIEEPGAKMNYNSGCSHLLSAILQQVSGRSTRDFADQHLFRPLGIADYLWHEDAQGVTNGGFGLSLLPRDLVKIGALYLHEGLFGKKQIVPKDWVYASTQPVKRTYDHIGSYARHWWTEALDPTQEMSDDNRYFFALGYGGQYIIVVPTAELVVLFTSEIYNRSLLPLQVFRECILPVLNEIGLHSKKNS